jgi:hypothetical protein
MCESSEHCVCSGAHTPVHVPPAHVLLLGVHEVPVAQLPFASQVCGLFPEHCICPGAHTPVHAPVTQVWLVHVAGDPHWPIASHVSTPLFTHWVVPAAHTPWHEAVVPFWTQVMPEQADGMPQLPPVHCCTPLPEHWLLPALQAPVQKPFMHVPVVQAAPAPHWPLLLHV